MSHGSSTWLSPPPPQQTVGGRAVTRAARAGKIGEKRWNIKKYPASLWGGHNISITLRLGKNREVPRLFPNTSQSNYKPCVYS